MRMRKRLFMVILPLVAGALAAVPLATADAAVTGGCEKNACNVESGNCVLSDVHLSCAEIAGGCQTTSCNAT